MAEVATASVFRSGRSQAVRIPKAFWFDVERVEIRKRGQEVILKPIAKDDQWAAQREVVEMAKGDLEPLFEMPEYNDRGGYPRMDFNESREHFEARVREYERRQSGVEKTRSGKYGQ